MCLSGIINPSVCSFKGHVVLDKAKPPWLSWYAALWILVCACCCSEELLGSRPWLHRPTFPAVIILNSVWRPVSFQADVFLSAGHCCLIKPEKIREKDCDERQNAIHFWPHSNSSSCVFSSDRAFQLSDTPPPPPLPSFNNGSKIGWNGWQPRRRRLLKRRVACG